MTPRILVSLFFVSEDESDSSNLDNNEELELNEELEQALDDTQPILSLQTADDVDFESRWPQICGA